MYIEESKNYDITTNDSILAQNFMIETQTLSPSPQESDDLQINILQAKLDNQALEITQRKECFKVVSSSAYEKHKPYQKYFEKFKARPKNSNTSHNHINKGLHKLSRYHICNSYSSYARCFPSSVKGKHPRFQSRNHMQNNSYNCP